MFYRGIIFEEFETFHQKKYVLLFFLYSFNEIIAMNFSSRKLYLRFFIYIFLNPYFCILSSKNDINYGQVRQSIDITIISYILWLLYSIITVGYQPYFFIFYYDIYLHYPSIFIIHVLLSLSDRPFWLIIADRQTYSAKVSYVKNASVSKRIFVIFIIEINYKKSKWTIDS